jgi:CheY-like chemotaxis protein
VSKTEKKVLVMDDEPHVLDWLIEYLEAQSYKVDIAVNVDQAIDALNRSSYRIAIFDLNVPASPEILNKINEKGSIHAQYRGLFAAEHARTIGMRGRQVVVYSVHDNPDILRRCNTIGVQYLIKARPREFKKELNNILSYDPTESTA